jgi:flagellar L-ring protein precursor FlgH
MKFRTVLIYLAVLLLLPFAFKIKAGDFGQSTSLFSDIKANKVGDILTVLISEQSQASNQVQTKTEKNSKHEASGGPGIGTFDFFPLFGAESDSKHSHDGKGQNVRNGNLQARMSVTVVAVKENGDLVVEGNRTVAVSGDKETIHLSGVVRQRDVTPDNTVPSHLIADAEISYTGKGATTTGTRPGFFTRVLNWLF